MGVKQNVNFLKRKRENNMGVNIIILILIGIFLLNCLFCFAMCKAASDFDDISDLKESEENNYFTNNDNTFISQRIIGKA